ncbi:Chaperone, tailless complex polypeptide 1 [Penicillium griseofulvum]|uniref:CCT-theta n=1 Tax=Penicillium patulum TaxID=5078 RepID=A0A135LG23_PENPA|nr:Chaperone, tailless complex polypeptide 1 [Penicillium griseofulvum]KXG47895.1 Chaperone, tailless complex polypeptide 1 [Penicillium griseofulvum]
MARALRAGASVHPFLSPKPSTQLKAASLTAQTSRSYNTPGSQFFTRWASSVRSQIESLRQSRPQSQLSFPTPSPSNRRTFFSSHQSPYQQRQNQYNRFRGNARRPVVYRLVQNAKPHHFVAIGVGISGLYLYNTEIVEMTGRRRFNCVSRHQELKMGEESYREVLIAERGKVLPHNHPLTRMVDGVLQRLVPQVPIEGADWKVHVIKDDSMLNAFVLPGGKVFVYTGILPICKDEDGLAAVLGHEIAHVVAHHPAERMSTSFITLGAVFAISFLFDVSGQFSSFLLNLMYSLPNSRTQEAEADKIGLMMMSKACFNPAAAVKLWARMYEQEKEAPPQFMSTHPSSYNRMEAIQGWLDKAEAVYDENGCSAIKGYMNAKQLAGSPSCKPSKPTTAAPKIAWHNSSIHSVTFNPFDIQSHLPQTRPNIMSLSIPGPSQAGLFKPGYQSHDAEDGAVIRNIEACQAISGTVQTSLGPYGRNKIVINHLQKMILTSDAATILRELDVVHPAAKLLVMASQQQDAEMGDGTNLVIVLAGELLKKAEELIRMGLKTSDIVSGYEKAQNFALSVLEELEVDRLQDMRSAAELSKALRTVVASKQSGTEDTLAALVAEAVLAVLPKNPVNFNVDNVRVVKIMGGSLEQSKVVKGMVFPREPDGIIKKATRAKVGVFSCPIDISQTETKGTVLLKNAKEMMDFTAGEEDRLETAIKELYDSGLRVVVAGSTVGDLAMHYLNRFNILVIKILSKFELRRLCRVVGATPLARLGAPMPDEMGQIDIVETTEIGGDRVTVFRQEDANAITRTATIVLRGATQNHLEDVERAIDDGVNVVKAITKDPRLVPGAGATEIQLVERISHFADRTPGLPQYAIRKFAEAFEVVPRTLAESAGLDATEVLSRLYTAHHRTTAPGESSEEEDEEEGSSSEDEEQYWTTGVDLEIGDSDGTLDTVEEGILDLMATKMSAIRLASESARTVLSVDQIIVSRQAGGPKPPQGGGDWDQD